MRPSIHFRARVFAGILSIFCRKILSRQVDSVRIFARHDVRAQAEPSEHLSENAMRRRHAILPDVLPSLWPSGFCYSCPILVGARARARSKSAPRSADSADNARRRGPGPREEGSDLVVALGGRSGLRAASAPSPRRPRWIPARLRPALPAEILMLTAIPR